MITQIYKSTHKTREVYDLTHVKDQLNIFYDQVVANGTKKAQGAGVRVGGSSDRGNISEYRYINTKKMLMLPELLNTINNLTKHLNIYEHMLTHNVLHLPAGGFLDWQDYYMWQKRSIRGNSFQVIGPVINFFSISLTHHNVVGFREENIPVDKHHAILFAPGDEHKVDASDHDRMWLVLGIADHVDMLTTLK